jgi:hypothetical protein
MRDWQGLHRVELVRPRHRSLFVHPSRSSRALTVRTSAEHALLAALRPSDVRAAVEHEYVNDAELDLIGFDLPTNCRDDSPP